MSAPSNLYYTSPIQTAVGVAINLLFPTVTGTVISRF